MIGTITPPSSIIDVQGLSNNRQDEIECNNFNFNANGFNVEAIPESLSGLRAAQAQTGDADIDSNKIGNEEKRFGSDNKDFAFKCLNNNDNELIIPPTTPPPPPCEVTVDTITEGIGFTPTGIAYDPVNRDMYVANLDDTVSVIDTVSNNVVHTNTVGNGPIEIAYDPINDRMYVTNLGDNTVSVINLCPRP